MQTELFKVYQFFAGGGYELVGEDLPPEEALTLAHQLATSVGGRIGTTTRIILTDDGDAIAFEWTFEKGVTFR